MVSQATRATGNTQVIAVADPVAMAKAAADRVIAAMVANGGRIAICLSGGSSPKRLYELLATEPYRSRIPWDRVHWFIGDERFVGPDDARNNMSMARHAFLDACAPTGAVHPIPIDTANPDEAAQEYERELKLFYGSETLDPARPLFDVVMLGVGPDGHTASLFPEFPAVEETERWVVGVPQANVEPFIPRISLTLPALASCREMLFQVSGAGKRSILTRVWDGENLPARRACTMNQTVWLVDIEALPENFRA